MRIVIDLQAAQEAGPAGDAALAMCLDFARCARDQELWIILNGALHGTIPRIRNALEPYVALERIVVFEVPWPLAGNSARRHVAQLLREHFIEQLVPDRLLLIGLPHVAGDAVISIDPAIPTALVLLDADASIDPVLLRRCDVVLAVTEPVLMAARHALRKKPAWLRPYEGAVALATLLTSTARTVPLKSPPLRIGLVSDSATLADRLAHHCAVRRVAPDAGKADLLALAHVSDVLLYDQDDATDAATLLASIQAVPGALLLQHSAFSPHAAGPLALLEAHGYAALVHEDAAYPGNLTLLQAASTVLYADPAVAAEAQRWYGLSSTRDWLAASDDAEIGVAVAKLYQRSRGGRHALLQQLAVQLAVPLPQVAYCLAQMPDPLAPRQLLVDVTAIVQHDLRTGIQRVVRTQLLDLLRREHTGLRVEPVYLSDRGGRWHYRYARAYALGLLGVAVPEATDAEVDVRAGDIFYGADYSPHVMAAAANGGLFDYWRIRGVALNFVVYDLLPVLRPEFFPDGSGQTQAAWLTAVASCADRLICISSAVAGDLATWLAAQGIAAPQLCSLHLGADVDDDASQAAPVAAELPAGATSAPAFLMVGTIEPRKGHLQALAAFDQLWADGVDVNLLIIGHEGWVGLPDAERRTIPAIVTRLQQHPQLGRRLFWLRGPSDAVLRQAYADCVCLLAASDGEGFGLPLIEAARYGMPVLARALPVFHEVAQSYASYFDGDAPGDLAAGLRTWLAAYRRGDAIRPEGMPWLTWHQNVDALLGILRKRTAPVVDDPGIGL